VPAQEQLRHDKRRNSEPKRNVHAKDLDEEDSDALDGGARQRSPSIADGSEGLAANDGGLDAAAEGAVEGDDGVLLGGQKASLDANEDDEGRKYENELEDKSEKDEDDAKSSALAVGGGGG